MPMAMPTFNYKGTEYNVTEYKPGWLWNSHGASQFSTETLSCSIVANNTNNGNLPYSVTEDFDLRIRANVAKGNIAYIEIPYTQMSSTCNVATAESGPFASGIDMVNLWTNDTLKIAIDTETREIIYQEKLRASDPDLVGTIIPTSGTVIISTEEVNTPKFQCTFTVYFTWTGDVFLLRHYFETDIYDASETVLLWDSAINIDIDNLGVVAGYINVVGLRQPLTARETNLQASNHFTGTGPFYSLSGTQAFINKYTDSIDPHAEVSSSFTLQEMYGEFVKQEELDPAWLAGTGLWEGLTKVEFEDQTNADWISLVCRLHECMCYIDLNDDRYDMVQLRGDFGVNLDIANSKLTHIMHCKTIGGPPTVTYKNLALPAPGSMILIHTVTSGAISTINLTIKVYLIHQSNGFWEVAFVPSHTHNPETNATAGHWGSRIEVAKAVKCGYLLNQKSTLAENVISVPNFVMNGDGSFVINDENLSADSSQTTAAFTPQPGHPYALTEGYHSIVDEPTYGDGGDVIPVETVLPFQPTLKVDIPKVGGSKYIVAMLRSKSFEVWPYAYLDGDEHWPYVLESGDLCVVIDTETDNIVSISRDNMSLAYDIPLLPVDGGDKNIHYKVDNSSNRITPSLTIKVENFGDKYVLTQTVDAIYTPDSADSVEIYGYVETSEDVYFAYTGTVEGTTTTTTSTTSTTTPSPSTTGKPLTYATVKINSFIPRIERIIR